MNKRIIILCLVVITCFSLFSCGGKNLDKLERDLYKKVETISSDDSYYLKYNGVSFYPDEIGFFAVKETPYRGYVDDGDVFLGWDGHPWGLGYISRFYSNTDQDPMFIYDQLNDIVYLSEHYDYRSDIFIIDLTDKKIKFSDAITEDEFNYDILQKYKSERDIILRSEKFPRIHIPITVFQQNGRFMLLINIPKPMLLPKIFIKWSIKVL